MSETKVQIIGNLADELNAGKKVYLGIITYEIEEDRLNISWQQPDGEAIFSKFYQLKAGRIAVRNSKRDV